MRPALAERAAFGRLIVADRIPNCVCVQLDFDLVKLLRCILGKHLPFIRHDQGQRAAIGLNAGFEYSEIQFLDVVLFEEEFQPTFEPIDCVPVGLCNGCDAPRLRFRKIGIGFQMCNKRAVAGDLLVTLFRQACKPIFKRFADLPFRDLSVEIGHHGRQCGEVCADVINRSIHISPVVVIAFVCAGGIVRSPPAQRCSRRINLRQQRIRLL